MKPQSPSMPPVGGLTRRQVLALGAMNLAGWLFPPARASAETPENDLELVSRIPRMAERESPLLIFRDFVVDPDGEVEQHIRQQLPQRQALLKQIREKIGFEKQVRFSVEATEVRLMFVPQAEIRPAAAYHRYCLDITDYLFSMNQADNFYTTITAPLESFPAIPEKGVSAFIVHRLAKAYRAVCRFSAETGQSVKYRVSGAIFSNHLGAVDLEIEQQASGQFGLRRRPFTIWQNHSAGLFNLMAIPVEETLHFYLGSATDRLIDETLRQTPFQTLEAARQLADEWMAVEEAVVGGLVDRVLYRYCAQYQVMLPDLAAATQAAEVPDMVQYRYRRRGIELVRNLGFRRSIDMYMENPAHFKAQLDNADRS